MLWKACTTLRAEGGNVPCGLGVPVAAFNAVAMKTTLLGCVVLIHNIVLIGVVVGIQCEDVRGCRRVRLGEEFIASATRIEGGAVKRHLCECFDEACLENRSAVAVMASA
jgi:hypothetical protein